MRQYCVNHLNKNPDADLLRMISDLLVYGAKTQIYQNYKTDELVTEGLSLPPSTYTTLDDSYNKQRIVGVADENVRYSAASLILSSDMTMRLRVTTEDPSLYTYENTYIQKNQNNTDNKLAELVQAIYNYGESAKLFED